MQISPQKTQGEFLSAIKFMNYYCLLDKFIISTQNWSFSDFCLASCIVYWIYVLVSLCSLLQLFVSLSAGCCYKLMHVNLARNPFSHRSAALSRFTHVTVAHFYQSIKELYLLSTFHTFHTNENLAHSPTLPQWAYIDPHSQTYSTHIHTHTHTKVRK